MKLYKYCNIEENADCKIELQKDGFNAELSKYRTVKREETPLDGLDIEKA